jgi:carboxyl-terminal processing protease
MSDLILVTTSRRVIGILMTLGLALALLLSGLLLGWQADTRHPRTGGLQGIDDFRVFWEAWETLERLFWSPEDLDSQQMIHGAVRGMLASLGDPYSAYLEPPQHRLDSDRLKGEFEGIGVELALEQDRVVVAAVYSDSPAARAGVLVGDTVMSVDGTSVVGLLVDEVRLLIRGPVGSMVEITLQRDPGISIALGIERQRIKVPSIVWELPSPAIGHVHIRSFSDRTPQELAQALEGLAAGGVQVMILDLRGNGGGVVEAAVTVLGQLLGKGIAYRELQSDGTETRYSVPFNPRPVDWPLAVLVDAGTASSAEIVAAAVRDHGRGLLYGQATFGKGSVQAVFTLQDGSSVHLTVARWLTSDGHTIDGIGLRPHVVINTDNRRQTELVLQTALDDLQSTLPKPVEGTIDPPLCNMLRR